MPESPEDVTLLLEAAATGDRTAGEALYNAVYRKLHHFAHAAMRRERPGHTLQTTALVHEAYLRLVRKQDEAWKNRAHFFKVAATAMRRILVDEARKKKAAKRGLGRRPLALDALSETEQEAAPVPDPFEDLEALDRALEKLGSIEGHERKRSVVELRFFVGLTLEETAEALDLSLATVKRDWEFTKAWLLREMRGNRSNAS
jgi:RNA polymerase sigma factor (TIGR02999 family)